jgi:uncharacterized membrane protein
MTTMQRAVVVGVFTERSRAEEAIDELHRAGFTDQQIGFIVRNATTFDMADETTADSTTGAAVGAVSGGVVGGLLGAASALLIPGLGLALAGGILAATLGGAALGAVAGGFVGALIALGIPEEEAHYYQRELSTGRTVVIVNTLERYPEAMEILRHNGAYDASTRQVQLETYEAGAIQQPAHDYAPAAKNVNLATSEENEETHEQPVEPVNEASSFHNSENRHDSRGKDEYSPNIPGVPNM